MWFWMFAVAALGHPYEGRETDVTASTTFDGSVAPLVMWLEDPGNYAKLFPESCARKVRVGDAEVRFTYITPPWKRKTTAYATRVDKKTGVVDWEHTGIGGFTSRFQIAKVEEGRVRVTLTHYVDMPPWPLRKPYFAEVQPSWLACSETVLANLAGTKI